MKPVVVVFRVRCLEPWIKYKTVYSSAEAALAVAECLDKFQATEVKVVPQNRWYIVISGRSSKGYAMPSFAM